MTNNTHDLTNGRIDVLKSHIKRLASNQEFRHNKWYVKYHLEVVEKNALELCDVYPEADRGIVLAMVWMHDYGKIIDFENQYSFTVEKGKEFMDSLDFESSFSGLVIKNIEVMDKKENLDLANIETRIVSSADGLSHYVTPFMTMYWWENPQKSIEDLISDSRNKIEKDKKKIVITEALSVFKTRTEFIEEFQLCNLPNKFFN